MNCTNMISIKESINHFLATTIAIQMDHEGSSRALLCLILLHRRLSFNTVEDVVSPKEEERAVHAEKEAELEVDGREENRHLSFQNFENQAVAVEEVS